MSQIAIDPRVASFPSFQSALGVTITHARPERVMGEMKIGAQHLAGDGSIHPGVLIGFASELALHGAHGALPLGRSVATIDVKTSTLKSCRSRVIGGEAVPLPADGALLVWQASIFDANGQITAIVVQTLLAADAAEAGAARDETAPDLAALPVKTSAKAKGNSPTIAEARREQIASAASSVIARKGFANATIREIADAAGLHVPTMYQYVSSKDEVLELVYRWTMERLRTDVDAATAGCATAREKLTATLQAMLANGDRYRRHVGVLNRELKSLQPKARARVLDEYQALLHRIGELISQGIANGEFRPVDPFIAANFVEGLADMWPLRPFAVGKYGLAAFQKEAAAFIIAGLAK